jgi:RHS repeat-associated protein
VGHGGGASPIAQTNLNYTGQRLDGTGLLYYHARYYDPNLARFVSVDSVAPGSASGGMDGVALKGSTKGRMPRAGGGGGQAAPARRAGEQHPFLCRVALQQGGAIHPAALRPRGLGRRRAGDQPGERETWPREVGQGCLDRCQLGRQLLGGLIVALLLEEYGAVFQRVTNPLQQLHAR